MWKRVRGEGGEKMNLGPLSSETSDSRSDILKEERHNGTAIKERWRSKGISRSVKAEMDGRMSGDE